MAGWGAVASGVMASGSLGGGVRALAFCEASAEEAEEVKGAFMAL